MDRVELKPCPFCGGDAEGFRLARTGEPKLEQVSDDSGGGWRVSCYTCRGGFWNGAYLTEQDAIAAWNTRQETP